MIIYSFLMEILVMNRENMGILSVDLNTINLDDVNFGPTDLNKVKHFKKI